MDWKNVQKPKVIITVTGSDMMYNMTRHGRSQESVLSNKPNGTARSADPK